MPILRYDLSEPMPEKRVMMIRLIQAGTVAVVAGAIAFGVYAFAGGSSTPKLQEVSAVTPAAAAAPTPAAVATPAADRRVPDNQTEITLSFAPIVKRVKPAVVNVHASRIVQTARSPFHDDPFFRHFFGNRGLGPPGQRVQNSLGSGVIIDKSGLVVTNYHVIENASEIKVALSDRREFDCEVILKDERMDLAVMRIVDGDGDFPSLSFADSDALEVGDLVLAIGDPFGVGQTVTSGIVSALARTQIGISDYQFFIQTDAAINPGNSGGALIDMQGRLVGINTAIFSRTGDSSGIGFAIPSNMVAVVARSAETGGVVRLPWTGVRFQDVTADIAESLGLDHPHGALVVAVADDSPGKRAGLAVGDLVVSVEEVEVEGPSAVNYRLATMAIGETARVGVLRDGKQYLAKVSLEPAPESVPRDELEISGRSPLSGVLVVNLSPAVAEELAHVGDPEGVIVKEVIRGSTAERAGFRQGDVVVDINGTAIDSTRTLSDVSDDRPGVWMVTIERDGRVIQSRFRG